ncbi:MAG: FAD-dependent oxidoreductase [Rhodospirillaceae bacterium]|nr:FAD-dependent oxidoreductase [Rhodospirillaceae bacterium]MBL6930559.1 FAD-dependent oxidoreductase [Rhodospirillales bacterium]
MNVYDISRIAPCDAPSEFADDTSDIHFVPAPCQVACPIGTDAPSYIAYTWEGKMEEAFEAITATNPFSSICGRVCDAPCEPACRRADSDGPIAIRNIKRFVMDKLGQDYKPTAIEVTRKETVGIVGGGPAGLTAAKDLAEAGFEVHVYEMMDRLGGMMVWGIPTFRLPDGIIDEDLNRLTDRCPGIKVHLSCTLGKDITLDELKGKHDVVLLSIGAWGGKTMTALDVDDARVVNGVDFLRDINSGKRPDMPETVLVIGGGDVAMDACRAAKRLPGCKDVKVVYRRGPEEIPARREELEGAVKEDIEFIYNVQPVAVEDGANGFGLTCVKTELGDPDEDGRRRPIDVAGSEHFVAGGLVIVAVGQQTECESLEKAGMMDWDRVRTDWDSMRTDDPRVFAAGDGAFGGSTIVMAMQHGHRAAYYMKALLNGIDNPLPYRTPYRTRRVPVAQDAEWEVINRQHQEFKGLGDKPVEFPEIEVSYDGEAARNEAARCYRCDAETGSADYTVHSREDIFVMARADLSDMKTQKAILNKRLQSHDDPFQENHLPTLDDLIFLPANLSRLVIDPYRDPCNVKAKIAGRIDLTSPLVAAGFDAAPQEIREALGAGLAEHGSAYIGTKQLPSSVPWLQLAEVGKDPVSEKADGVLFIQTGGFKEFDVPALSDDQIIGLSVSKDDLSRAIPFALDNEFDVLLLNACPGNGDWPELVGNPDLSVIRDALRLLRAMNREEDIEILYFGGVRSGTDLAKIIGLGANGAALGASLGFALGGSKEGNTMTFSGDSSQSERAEAVALLMKSLSSEASIMARCTGKTDVHNIEPEDLRSITRITSEATGIQMPGKNALL